MSPAARHGFAEVAKQLAGVSVAYAGAIWCLKREERVVALEDVQVGKTNARREPMAKLIREYKKHRLDAPERPRPIRVGKGIGEQWASVAMQSVAWQDRSGPKNCSQGVMGELCAGELPPR